MEPLMCDDCCDEDIYTEACERDSCYRITCEDCRYYCIHCTLVSCKQCGDNCIRCDNGGW